MIFIAVFFVGLINGLFASGAGQILIISLILLIKMGDKEAHRLSVSVLSITSVISLVGYLSLVDLEIFKVLIVILVSLISGYLGSIIVKRIPGNVLGLLSGLILTILSAYRLIKP